MKTVTPTELRANIYRLLDEVLRTGVPVAVKRGDQLLQIVPAGRVDKFQQLPRRPEVIQGDPEDLVEVTWEHEVNLDLP
ncbi:MAG: type II toxin-antitoxin system Phd/YefM family antitoxin [Caldilineae bacterium]|nr:MAG: type II toxin-antitoxin system Phd/YefM family antitoxin [Caldilineae bacterium]